jgi:hypothetical protein
MSSTNIKIEQSTGMSTDVSFNLLFTQYWEKFYHCEDRRGIRVYSAMLKSLKSVMNNYCRVSQYGVNEAIVKKWVRRFKCPHRAQKYIDEMDDMIDQLKVSVVYEHILQKHVIDQRDQELATLYVAVIKQYMQVLTESETATFLKMTMYKKEYCEQLFIV